MENIPKTDARPLTKQVFNPETGKFTTEEVDESEIQPKSPELPSLESLAAMSKDELIALITTVGGAIWGYALMNDEQKAEAARLKLYNLGMSSNEVQKVVPALDKWFDRTQGKAAQSIALDVKDNRMDRMPIDQLLLLARNLSEPVIINPLPSLTDSST